MTDPPSCQDVLLLNRSALMGKQWTQSPVELCVRQVETQPQDKQEKATGFGRELLLASSGQTNKGAHAEPVGFPEFTAVCCEGGDHVGETRSTRLRRIGANGYTLAMCFSYLPS